MDSIISNIVPDEYIFNNDNDIHRIYIISTMVKTQVPHINETRLIKGVIFYILRKNSTAFTSIIPYILVGIKNISISTIQTSQDIHLVTLLLKQSEESYGDKMLIMDIINVSLSNIVDSMPLDLKESMTPTLKSKISKYLLDTQLASESFNNTPTQTIDSQYAAIRNELNSQQSATSMVSISRNVGDSSTKAIAPPAQSPSNINATYVDFNPILHEGSNSKAYIYEKTNGEGALYNIPNNLHTITGPQLKKMLESEYGGVSSNQIQNVMKYVGEQFNDSTPTPSPTTKTQDMVNVIQQYQDHYLVTNNIVSWFLIILIILVICYIIYKLFVPTMPLQTSAKSIKKNN